MASYAPPDDMALPLDDHALLSGPLRRGKWTPEEEAYAAAIIQYFLSGVLPIQYGTTLRGYIATLLHCDPMRVSKKLIPGSILVGVRIDPKIGRRSYYPCDEGTPGLADHTEVAIQRLAQARALFIESIEREELHEQASSATAQADLRRLSPLRHKVGHAGDSATSVVYMRPLANQSDAEDNNAPSTLPSLSDLLRQNRLRVPSKTLSPPHVPSQTLEYQYLHPTHASVFHYASPPRRSSSDDSLGAQTPASPPP